MKRLQLLPLCAALFGLGLAASAQATDLVTVYQAARDSDPQLRIADAQVGIAAEGVVQTRAALLPNISGRISTSHSRNSGTLGSGDTFTSSSRGRNYGVDLNQSIYDHSNYTRLRGNRVRARAAEFDYDEALNGLLLRTAELYFAVLTARDNLASAEAEETAVGRQLEQADQRFEVGLTAITDVHEARARFDNARARVILQQASLDDALEALRELTGSYFDDLRRLRDDLPLDPPEPANIDDWVSLALGESPSLRSRELLVEAADYGVRSARAGHLPTLGASVSYGDSALLSGESGPFSTRGSDQTTIALALSVPIFEGFATQSRVRQAVLERDTVSEQLDQNRRLIARQTRNDYRAVIAGISEVQAREQALISAQSAVEATQAGFEVGTRTIVDVLLSQQQLFQAQRDYSNARHQFILSGLRLKQSAGVIDVSDLQAVNALLR